MKLHLTKRTHRNALLLLRCKQWLLSFLNRNIRDIDVSRLYKCVTPSVVSLDASLRLYVPMYSQLVCDCSIDSRRVNRFSSWIGYCLGRLRRCGHIAVYRLVEALGLLCAYTRLFSCSWLQYAPHSIHEYNELILCANCIDSADCSLGHLQVRSGLVLRLFFSQGQYQNI